MLQAIGKGIQSLVTAIVLVIMLPVAAQEKKCRYGKEDINFGKFYKASTNTNRRFLRDVFIIMFYRARIALVESWPTTVEDYCFDILGWSRKKYRDSFNAEERKHFTVSVESIECDVSLLNKLIIKLFDGVNLPGTFFNALREIKNVRNRVCHDQLDFTEESLQANMEDLKSIFQKLLDEVKSVFIIDVSVLQQKYCGELDEIMAAPITGEGTSYFDKMEKFREDLMGKFITHGRKELFDFFAKLKVLNPFTWLRDDKFSELQVDKIFTPLHISDQNILIDLESLLVTEPFDEDNLGRSKGILPSVIILTGIAGCGKTSLCRYLLYDWRTRLGTVTNMRSVDILILIEARNITTGSLVTYLQRTLLKETCSHFEEKDILPTLQKLNVLYVVDGMDEATADGRKLLNEMFSVLGNSRVILTTRPEFTSSIVWSVLNHHLTYMKLQIHGFSDKGIAKFTSKVFCSLENDEKKRSQQEMECLRFLMTTGKGLGDHLKIPLTLALLIILWRDDKSSLTKITSVTRLYSEIFKMCAMKMLSRVRKTTSSTCLDLETFVEEWLLELGKMAYEMVRKDEYVITNSRRKFLTSICNKYCVDSNQILSAFLICEVHEGLGGVQYIFSFIHKSQMEYLAGQYHALMLTKDFDEKSNSSVTKTTEKFRWLMIFDSLEEISFHEIVEMKKMMNVYMFTIGHLCMQNNVKNTLLAKVAAKMLSMTGLAQRVPSLWRLVQESERHPLICKMVGDSISDAFIWKPEGEELCDSMDPTLHLLKYTNFTPRGLMVRLIGNVNGMAIRGDNDRVEMRPYANLVPILQSVAKKPEVNVVLRVDQHFYNWGDLETTDVLLEALTPNGNLTGFMGHMGVVGAKSLRLLREVQVVNVRISTVEALHELADSIGAMNRKAYLELTLRLDISPDVLPSSLPRFQNLSPFNIVLANVGDEKASWASQVVVQLSGVYNGVELVSSTLTVDGGKIFLNALSEKKVKVEEKISIRSFHISDEKALSNLEKLAKGKLDWW